MHKHDLDLIAEYAAGTLSDESEARARVESCGICGAEYREQKMVLAELSTVTSAAMTDHERAQLRRDLWTELRSSSANATPGRANQWWTRWAFGAAAFVFVAVALIGVMENFGGADQATETFSEIGSGLDSDQERASEEAADDGEMAPYDSGEGESLPESGADLAERYESTPYLLIAREVRQQPKTDPAVLSHDESQIECLDQSGLVDHYPVSGFETMTELLVAVPTETEPETAPVAFVDPESCIIVHIED